MAGYLSIFAFKTTYLYNAGRNYLSPKNWPWYNRIDENLILGAIPTKSMIKDLKVDFLDCLSWKFRRRM